jgi:hypothetical protein
LWPLLRAQPPETARTCRRSEYVRVLEQEHMVDKNGPCIISREVSGVSGVQSSAHDAQMVAACTLILHESHLR